jgi:hypothetical protein
MSDAVNVELKDLGIINGMHTTQVINADTGEVIGYNQTALEEEATE